MSQNFQRHAQRQNLSIAMIRLALAADVHSADDPAAGKGSALLSEIAVRSTHLARKRIAARAGMRVRRQIEVRRNAQTVSRQIVADSHRAIVVQMIHVHHRVVVWDRRGEAGERRQDRRGR